MIHRASFALGAACVSLLLAQSGCKDQGSPGAPASTAQASTSATAPPDAKGKKALCAHPLVIWPSLSTDNTRYLKEQAKAFEKDTGVGAKFLDVPFVELQKKFIQAVPSGQGPDLLVGPNDWAGALSEGGFIADLSGKVDVTRYLDATVKAATYKGKLLGVPESFEIVTQYYNADLTPAGNKSFEDIKALGAKLPKGSYPLAYDIGNFYHSVAFLHAAGGSVLDAEGNVAITEEAATKWLTALKDLKEKANLPKEVTGESAKALFLSGKSASFLSGPWDVPDVIKSKVNWKIARMPQVDGSDARPFLGAKLFYISSKSDCIDSALAFVEKFTSAASEVELVKSVNPAHLPAAKAAHDDPALKDNATLQGFRAQAEASVPFPNSPAMGSVWTPANEAIAAVLNQGAEPAAAAKKMVETIKANIQKQK
jgi:arabinogalactan oligomer/maltooligosaccharide transport system substrate-binding protein